MAFAGTAVMAIEASRLPEESLLEFFQAAREESLVVCGAPD